MTDMKINIDKWEYIKELNGGCGDFIFPEIYNGLVSNNVGVCISGGGNRSFACGIGQIKALNHLEYDKKIDYFSSVSGGSWITSLYFFAKHDYKRMFGPIIEDPSHINMSYLCDASDDVYLGHRSTEPLDHSLDAKLPFNKRWIDMVKNNFLTPYGLGDRKMIAFGDQDLQRIFIDNPGLNVADFLTMRKDRLCNFPIFNSTILSKIFDIKHGIYDAKLPLTTTPIYTGVLSHHNFNERAQTGNGFVSTYGFTSNLLSQSKNKCEVELIDYYDLSEVIGQSSAFFALLLEKFDIFDILEKFIPEQPYWPLKKDFSGSTIKKVGDGGNLENLGIIPMLQRRVKNIIIFCNSEQKLANVRMENNKWIDIDEFLPPLFNKKSSFFPKSYDDLSRSATHVFEENQWDDFYSQLIKNNKNTGTAYFMGYLNVVRNAYGIEPYRPRVLLIYNTLSDHWMDLLSMEIRNNINQRDSGLFCRFPNYSTVMENHSGNIINDLGVLTIAQSKLLTEFSFWNIFNNRKLFDPMILNQ